MYTRTNEWPRTAELSRKSGLAWIIGSWACLSAFIGGAVWPVGIQWQPFNCTEF